MTMHCLFRIFAINLLLFPLSAMASAPLQQNEQGSAAEIVIQQGMIGKPSHVALTHRREASFMEVFREDGEQLWRKVNGEKKWQVLRRWNNRSRSGGHSRDGKDVYESIVHDGMVDIYNSRDWSLVFRAKLSYKVYALPEVYFGPAGSHYQIIKISTYDSGGRKVAKLWFSPDGKKWQAARKPGTMKSFWQIREGFFAGKSFADEYRIYQMTRKGLVEYTKLPGTWRHIHSVFWLGAQTFAIGERVEGLAKSFDSQDKGMRWKLYSWHKTKGWISAQAQVGKPESIRGFTRIGDGYFSIQMRGIQPKEPMNAERIYHEVDDGGVERLAAMKTGSPTRLEQFVVYASGDVIGMREHDDQDQDGLIGSWQWRMHSSKGWGELSQLLPSANARILRVVEWLKGDGLGIEVADANAQTTWHWFMRNKGGAWQPLSKHIPSLAGVAVTKVDEVRDGLFGFVEDGKDVKSPETGSSIRLAAKKVRWYVHVEDGSWQPVNDLLGQAHHPDYVNHIASVDARTNALMIRVEPNPGDPLINLILYRQRNGHWHELDRLFYQTPQVGIDTRLLPRAKAIVDIDTGVVLLERELLEAWYANKDAASQQVLYRKGEQWYLMPDTRHDVNAPLVYDQAGRILMRDSNVPEERSWFLLDDKQGWTELHKLLPDAPDAIASAYSFLDRRGIAIQEYQDSNKDGKAFQWTYYLRADGAWQPLKSKLPGIRGDVDAVIDIGKNSLSVQSEDKWHYFSATNQGEWFNITESLPNLPKRLDSVHVSSDGRVLVAKEEWDTDKNGKKWEVFIAVRKRLSDRFTMLGSLLPDAEKLSIISARSLWRGGGIAIETAKVGKNVRVGSKFIERSRWQFYIWHQGKLASVSGLPKASSFRTSSDG